MVAVTRGTISKLCPLCGLPRSNALCIASCEKALIEREKGPKSSTKASKAAATREAGKKRKAIAKGITPKQLEAYTIVELRDFCAAQKVPIPASMRSKPVLIAVVEAYTRKGLAAAAAAAKRAMGKK